MGLDMKLSFGSLCLLPMMKKICSEVGITKIWCVCVLCECVCVLGGGGQKRVKTHIKHTTSKEHVLSYVLLMI